MCARTDVDATYEKVASSERDSAFQVPFLTIQEIMGILEDGLLHASVEDDGVEGAFRTGGDEAPITARGGSVD